MLSVEYKDISYLPGLICRSDEAGCAAPVVVLIACRGVWQISERETTLFTFVPFNSLARLSKAVILYNIEDVFNIRAMHGRKKS